MLINYLAFAGTFLFIFNHGSNGDTYGAYVATVLLVWFFGGLVLYLIVGVLRAYLMQPLVTWFQGRGMGRIAAIARSKRSGGPPCSSPFSSRAFR